jgi:pimeloyl-ACP methyl ester carboxylesterase
MAKPAFIFLHGAWHRPSCFDQVRDLLKTGHGITSLTVTNPSTAGDVNLGLKDDVANARAIITNELDKGQDVIVVAHSYGGFVASSAIKGLTQSRSSKRPEQEQVDESSTQGHVIGLVLITSMLFPSDRAFIDNFPQDLPFGWWLNNNTTGFAELLGSSSDKREVFYNDMPAHAAEEATKHLMPQSLKSFYEDGDVAYAGWMDVPTWFIAATQDHTGPVGFHRAMVVAAQELGADVTMRELNTSHSPFLSQPEEVVKVIVDAAKVFESGERGSQQ